MAVAARGMERRNGSISGPTTSCPIKCPLSTSPSISATLSSSLPHVSSTTTSYFSSGKSLPPLSSSWGPTPSTSSSSSVPSAPLSHDPFETALNNYLQHETKDNFIKLLSEVFLHGYAIDFEMKGGQTLLHHSVSLNLERETALILNSGARILTNNQNKTPIDFALERGNQLILQLLRRSSDYFNYLKSKKNSSTYHLHTRVLSSAYHETAAATAISSFPGQQLQQQQQQEHQQQQQLIYGVCKYAWSPTQCKHPHESSIWAPSFHFTDVYEDYLDWKDGKLLEMLKELVDNLRATEVKFQNELEFASKQKDSSLSQILLFMKDLKQKEHKNCMKIWNTVEYERATRKLLEAVSLKLIDLKSELSEAHRKVFFFGEGYMRYFNGFVVKTSKRVNIRITGTALQLGYACTPTQEKEMKASSSSSSKTRSRIIPIDTIDEIEISSEVNSVSLNQKNHENRSSSSNATARASFTVRDSNEHMNNTNMATLSEPLPSPSSSSPSDAKNSSTGKVYFILRFRNLQSTSRPSHHHPAGEEMDGEGKTNLSPVLGVPMRTPPPPHPIVLCLDDSWGEIVTPVTKIVPEKIKEKSLFARAKAKLSGKKTTESVITVPESPPIVTYRAKSVAHEFFEAIQSASIPETHFYGTEHFLNRNRESISRGSDPHAESSPGEVRDGSDWNVSSISSTQISSCHGTSGLTSVESLLSGSHRTSLASYQSRSSQSGFRMSFLERDSLQSADSTKFSKSLPKSHVEILDSPAAAAAAHEPIPTKKTLSSSYQGPRSTLLGRVAEEREDRSTSNDSSSLSHGSSQLMGLTIASDPFHDCSRSLHKEFAKFPLVEGDEDTQDQEDWKSVGSERETQNDCSRQYSLDSADKLVSITLDDETFVEKPVMSSPPSLLTLSLQATSLPKQGNPTLSSNQIDQPTPRVPVLNSQPIESYSCPTTNYIPSAIEGYGPIPVTSPVASPMRGNPRLVRKHSSGSFLQAETIPIRKESMTDIPKSYPESELSSSFPMDSILRHMSSHPDCSTSLSIFGESMMATDSFHDPEYLPSLSLDHLPATRPSFEPTHHSMHTVSFKDEVEIDERLSCSSLPTALMSSSSKSNSERQQVVEIQKRNGHSFSHPEAHRHGHKDSSSTPSMKMISFERSLLLPEAMSRHVVYSLTQEMNSTREHRKELESSLISCVMERENLLQTLHYLQSLRNAMKHSPAAPSENHSTKHSLHDRYGRKKSSGIASHSSLRDSRESSGELSVESMSSHPDRNISQLSALLSAAVSNGLNDESKPTEVLKNRAEEASEGVPIAEPSRQLSRDLVFREERLPSNLTEEKDRHVSEAEEFVYNLLSETREGVGARGGDSGGSGPKQEKPQSSKDSDEMFLSLSLSQLIGPPPAPLINEYERGRDLLETLWHHDMIIFETVEKLAQCLYLREQAWQRLRKLQSQESTFITPQDLYDIDLLS